MARFATSSLGRVLLHLLALIGDREWRFHSAGICREFSAQ